ncbi:MAG: hypothetical protein P4N60_24525 [Verrucomicrobiae bacterium]|nr:hypothetical protein [Verrucomicrobiae bacterium]
MKAATTHPELLQVLGEARVFLARSHNDFAWSSWDGTADALREIDGLISRIASGDMPKRLDLEVLFAPTGPIQEVSVSSGWGEEFLGLAERFDAAMKTI